MPNSLLIPADDLGPAPLELQPMATRFRSWMRAEQWNAAADGRPDPGPWLPVSWEPSSWAEWPTAMAETTVAVWPSPAYAEQLAARYWSVRDLVRAADVTTTTGFLWWKVTTKRPGAATGFRIPWSSTFRGAAGTTDQGLLLIADPAAGVRSAGVELLNPRRPWPLDVPALEYLSGGTFDPDRDLVADLIAMRPAGDPDPVGNVAGMGRSWKRRGLLSPGMVEGVEAPSALSVVGFNLQTGPSATYLRPASRVEHPELGGGPLGEVFPERRVPQGLRLAASAKVLTDGEIDARLRARRLSGAYLDLCRWAWRLVRSHGFVVGKETGGYRDATTGRPGGGPVIEATTAAPGYPDAARWRAVGLRSLEDALAIFDGFPWDVLYVVRPA